MSDFEERIFAPTARRRLAARRQGEVAQSAQLTGGALLLVCAALALWGSGDVMLAAARWLKGELSSAPAIDAAAYEPTARLQSAALAGASLAAGSLTVLLAAALVIELLQAGVCLAWNRLAVDASRLNGAARMAMAVSPSRWCGVGLQLALPLLALGLFVASRAEDLTELLHASPPELAVAQSSWMGDLLAQLGAAMLLTGGVHYAWRRWRHELSLRMTREDLREEERQAGGGGARSSSFGK